MRAMSVVVGRTLLRSRISRPSSTSAASKTWLRSDSRLATVARRARDVRVRAGERAAVEVARDLLEAGQRIRAAGEADRKSNAQSAADVRLG